MGDARDRIFLFGQVSTTSLLPLAVLVGGFEAIHALHVGAERIGRALQVQHEAGGDGPQWETAAMTVGPALPGGGVDPLFSLVFVGAAALNLMTALEPPPPWPELAVVAACHALFVFRVIRAPDCAARVSERWSWKASGRCYCASAIASRTARCVPRQESVVSKASSTVCEPVPLPPASIVIAGMLRLSGMFASVDPSESSTSAPSACVTDTAA